MAFSIRNPKAEALARQAAQATGEGLTDAILPALGDRLARLQGARGAPQLVDRILDIARRCGSLPDLEDRSADEILGFTGEPLLFKGEDFSKTDVQAVELSP